MNMSFEKSINESILDAVSNADIFDSPYSHIRFRNIFSDRVYSLILNSLPKTEQYEQFLHPDAKISEYESTRLKYFLSEGYIPQSENINKLENSDIWMEIVETLSSKWFRKVLFDKLNPDLIKRFKIPLDDIPCSPHICLFRDITGYKITPHPDTPKKAVTFQIYLPENNDMQNVGTWVYTKNKDKTFNKLKQFDFSPNTGYAFAVSKNSWHGVEQVENSKPRNTLMVIYYLDVPPKRFDY